MKILSSLMYYLAIGIGISAFSVRVRTGATQTTAVLDLTEKVVPSEAGVPGIPGQSFGSVVGAKNTSGYELPVDLQILGVSTTREGNFSIEVNLRNTGLREFELPRSTNLTSVETPANKAQRLFFFKVERFPAQNVDSMIVGSAVVGSSASLPNSTMTLAPGQSVRIILPVSAKLLSRAISIPSDKFQARISCEEWKLEDNRYFIEASSEVKTSKNSINFSIKDGKPIAEQP